MNITCIHGSPRANSISSAIADVVTDYFEEKGHRVFKYKLNSLKYKGCQACMMCKIKLDHCNLKDDLSKVLEKVKESDVLILATPVYYGDVSAQMKGFIDRTFSYLKPGFFNRPDPCRLKSGKKLIFIQIQGHEDESVFNDIYPRYEFFFKFYGYKENNLIRGCGIPDNPDDARWKRLEKQAISIAQKLILNE